MNDNLEALTETPDECDYRLVMYGPDGSSLQEVSMSRAEFVALKDHLRISRGEPAERENARPR